MIAVLALGSSALTLVSILIYIFVGGTIGYLSLGGIVVGTVLTVLLVNSERAFLGKDTEEGAMQGDNL